MRGTIKRGFALLGLAGLTLSASLLGTPVTAHAELPAKPPAAGIVSHKTELSAGVRKLMKGSGAQAEAKALETYWTPERMRAARPVERTLTKSQAEKAARSAGTVATGAAGSVAPAKVAKVPATRAAASSGIEAQVSQPGLSSNHPAARTNGKVFFSHAGDNYVCSASIVNSEGKSLVWTAGHCLTGDQQWSYNVAFVPAYKNGSAPWGVWYARELTTTSAWFYDNEAWAYDVGAMTMDLNPNVNASIANYLGAQGIKWNQGAKYKAAAFGYPQASPFNGQYLYRANDTTTDYGDGTIYMYSGMTGGSSGGPWFRSFNGKWGYVNGHNDFIYREAPLYMFSPYYGNQVRELYNAVRYETVNLTTATPKITGTAKVGNVLTANPGTWKPAPVDLSYQWKVGGKAVSGATASTFTVPASANGKSTKGKTITVTVRGSKTGYLSASKTSKATKKVKAGTLAGVTPTITGIGTVGQILTATTGTWAPAPVTLSYQWYRNGKKIKNAKSLTYTLVKADKGKKITIKATGKKTGYTTLTKTSKKTGKVKAA